MNSLELTEMMNALLHRLQKEGNHKKRMKQISGFREWLQWLRSSNQISQKQYDIYEANLQDTLSLGHTGHMKVNKIQPFITLSIVLLIICFVAVLGMLISRKGSSLVSDVDEPRILPFRGLLLDSNGTPITEKTDVTFNLYESTDSESPLYVGVCQGESGITPDFEGTFNVSLGSDCSMSPLPQGIFEKYGQLFLGVEIANQSELLPRYLLYTGPINDAETLNGMQAGTKKGTIVYLDQNNDINFSDEDPSLKSTSGSLTLSGVSLSLISTGEVSGNIEITPGILGSVLVTGGNVGIGTLSPRYRLHTEDSEPNSAVASFNNLSRENIGDMNVLNLGVGVDGSDPTAFIHFYKNTVVGNEGDLVGSIELNDDRVVYNSSGADYAEYFNSIENIPTSYIVGLSPIGIRKAISGDIPIGVVSDNAGFVGNKSDKTESQVLVGLVGQVRVLVSDENGQINKGDMIGVSSIAGLGTKTDLGTIGYALDIAKFSGDMCPSNIQAHVTCAYIDVLLK